MKANRSKVLPATVLTLIVAACAGAPPVPTLPAPTYPTQHPAPTRRPTPPPVQRPAPPPAQTTAPTPPTPAPPSLPAPRASSDWRDAPRTPGTWLWRNEGSRSTATYAQPGQPPVASLTCDRSARAMILWRTGRESGPAPLAVTTTSAHGVLEAAPAAPGGVAARLVPGDPLLDAIAFSRGRFMLELPGNAALYLPSWPELSRVIEDCR